MTREVFPTRYQALAAESAAIHTERPLHNLAHSTGKWSRVNYKTVAGEYRVARITCRPCTRRPIHNLVVVDCPGCGIEHRHGVTSLDVFRGYADRYPHCQGRSSSWVSERDVSGAWGQMLIWQQIVIDRDNLPREITQLNKETHDSRTERDSELRRRWALAAYRITNADGFGLAPASSAPHIEAGYKLFPANP